MNPKQRSLQLELLDKDDIPFEDIVVNMQELNFINTWLGGHKITIDGFKQLAQNKTQLIVCEVGCGGGDNLVAIARHCRQHNIHVEFIGVDIKEPCIALAAEQPLLKKNTTWLISDYRKVTFPTKPDIIFSSLFCHHFTSEELQQQLLWMKNNSRIGFFINDLERNRLAYHLIKILTQIFSKSYLVKHDAPLSVARAYLQSEWQTLLQQANCVTSTIKWKWAFRYLITYRHG